MNFLSKDLPSAENGNGYFSRLRDSRPKLYDKPEKVEDDLQNCDCQYEEGWRLAGVGGGVGQHPEDPAGDAGVARKVLPVHWEEVLPLVQADLAVIVLVGGLHLVGDVQQAVAGEAGQLL